MANVFSLKRLKVNYTGKVSREKAEKKPGQLRL